MTTKPEPPYLADFADRTEANAAVPITGLLEDLYLLGDKRDMAGTGAGAVFGGPPPSVAVIEAGATALSKWWSAGGAGVIGAVWLWAGNHWPKNDPSMQHVILWVCGLLSVAIVLAIGHLLAADVTARSAAAVATYNARATIAARALGTSIVASTPAPGANGARPAGTDSPDGHDRVIVEIDR